MTFKWLAYSQSEGSCYLSPTLKKNVILVQTSVLFSLLGYLRLTSWGRADVSSSYAFWQFSPKNFRLFLGQPKGPFG